MRGYRLQQANRIARKLFYSPNFLRAKGLDPKYHDIVLGMLRKTRKGCSCWMCRNRRQDEGLTFQERRQIEPEY
jgi:hypothetical protein